MGTATQTLRFASGISDEDEVHDALDETLGPISEELGSEPADLALVFCTLHHADQFPCIVERVHRQLSPRVALGVTACGVIGGETEIERRAGLTILAGQLPGVRMHAFTTDVLDTEDTPESLHRAVCGPKIEKPAAVLLFGDPFSLPLVKLLPALNTALPDAPIIGGMASAGMHGGDNRLMYGDTVYREGGIGVALEGAIAVDCTVSQGCKPIGRPFVVTQAHNNIIQQIGGRSVLQTLRSMADTLDEEDRRLMHHGLLVGRAISEYKDRFGRGDFLIRNILGADEDTGSLAIADFVRAGQTIQFHVRDARTAEEDLCLLLEKQRQMGAASGALLTSCNGRGTHMFAKPNTESRLISQALGQAPLAGMFAAGEIGPIGRQNFVHGFTASLAVFRPA